RIKAGDGGRGAVAFNKIKMSLGPAGGNGGDGGSIFFEGVSDLSSLSQFRNKKEAVANNGGNGRGGFVDGPDGDDSVLKVPVGTMVTKLETGEVQEVVKVGERILLAKGGHGGKGNYKFRSSLNTSPKQFQEGKPGEEFKIKIELKLIADVGLIGLPNAGKSSLLNELTGAKSKVANYPFTTLEPSLGVYYELILADIPGLIEGASQGKGLGIKFLQHIERTKILFHLISVESEDLARDYKIVRGELEKYSKNLAVKEEYLFLSKYDVLSAEDLKEKLAMLKKLNKSATVLSIYDDESLKKVKVILNKVKDSK
ncbi:MAG: GTPase ObgE, partial [Candidatus Taylorbacteria bacterium]|nr:GTPase ObgE [Candidatus Taylorbacteria bacterium]